MPRMDAGLVYIERSKTDQAGEGAYVVITPDTLAVHEAAMRQDSDAWTDDESGVRAFDVSDKSPRGQHGESRRDWVRGTPVIRDAWDLAIRMTRRGAPLQAVQTHGRWKSPSMPARYTRSEKALEALEWLV